MEDIETCISRLEHKVEATDRSVSNLGSSMRAVEGDADKTSRFIV